MFSEALRGGLPLLLLLGLALGTTWYLQRVERQLEIQVERPAPAEVAEGWEIEVLGTDAAGQPSFQLLSPHVTEAAGNLGTNLEQPLLTLYESDRGPARATAEKGWLAADQSLLRLDGSVNLWRAQGQGNDGSRLQTRWLLVYPELKQAETEAAVLITAPGQQLRGVGLRADLENERYELLSEVRGRHQVDSR